MLILNKDFEAIQKKAEKELIKVGINASPGSIAKLFLAIINSEQAEFYETLTIHHMQCFVSTASESYLDKIGELLNCKRNESEEDENYRYRITKQCLLSANANETAIRIAALSIDGIDNVYLMPFTHGIGSFSVYVINNTGDVRNDTLLKVADAVEYVQAFGNKADVLLPNTLQVEMEVKLMFNASLSESVKDEVKIRARKEIMTYISNLGVGEPIIINELSQLIMQQHDDILNYSIISFKIDEANVMIADQYLEQTEKFIVASKQQSIKVY